MKPVFPITIALLCMALPYLSPAADYGDQLQRDMDRRRMTEEIERNTEQLRRNADALENMRLQRQFDQQRRKQEAAYDAAYQAAWAREQQLQLQRLENERAVDLSRAKDAYWREQNRTKENTWAPGPAYDWLAWETRKCQRSDAFFKEIYAGFPELRQITDCNRKFADYLNQPFGGSTRLSCMAAAFETSDAEWVKGCIKDFLAREKARTEREETQTRVERIQRRLDEMRARGAVPVTQSAVPVAQPAIPVTQSAEEARIAAATQNPGEVGFSDFMHWRVSPEFIKKLEDSSAREEQRQNRTRIVARLVFVAILATGAGVLSYWRGLRKTKTHPKPGDPKSPKIIIDKAETPAIR